MKDKNLIKDVQRGRSSARLAEGATLYDDTDDSHVKRTTPLQTKMGQVRREGTRNRSAAREEHMP